MLSETSILLTNHRLTLKDISQNQHLVEQDLKKELNEDLDNWSSSVLSASSSSLDTQPRNLLELLDPVHPLKINSHHQTIQGIYIGNPEVYEQVRFVVESEHLEDWQPDEEDILRLLDEAVSPSPKF